MSQLPKEWEAIVDECGVDSSPRECVERCYALHCKPQRELTDAEIDQVCIKVNSYFVDPANYRKAYKELLEAHQRKQQEPEKVKFRAARMKDDHERIAMCRTDDKLNDFWEWLEPAQEIEVTLP